MNDEEFVEINYGLHVGYSWRVDLIRLCVAPGFLGNIAYKHLSLCISTLLSLDFPQETNLWENPS